MKGQEKLREEQSEICEDETVEYKITGSPMVKKKLLKI